MSVWWILALVLIGFVLSFVVNVMRDRRRER